MNDDIRDEAAILEDLHELQRQEDAIREQKRGLDQELARRHRLERVKAAGEDVTIATTGQG